MTAPCTVCGEAENHPVHDADNARTDAHRYTMLGVMRSGERRQRISGAMKKAAIKLVREWHKENPTRSHTEITRMLAERNFHTSPVVVSRWRSTMPLAFPVQPAPKDQFELEAHRTAGKEEHGEAISILELFQLDDGRFRILVDVTVVDAFAASTIMQSVGNALRLREQVSA